MPLVLMLWLAVAGQAAAHQIVVFAVADGTTVAGRAYFAGGAAVAGAPVRIEDGRGRVLAQLETDPDGRFRYRASSAIDHRVVVLSGDGHRAEWVVSAAELEPAFAATGEGVGDPDSLEPAVAAAIERAVARQLAPLRDELVAARARVGLRDVLGGIGYILGVFGLAAWWRARSASRSESSRAGPGGGA